MIKLTKPSVSEKDYIIAGCNDKIRNDGRGIHDFRSISIENNIFPHTNGSARLRIGHNTDLVCSVKVEVLEAIPDVENDLTQGTIDFSVDISPSCQLKQEDKKITEFANILGQQIQRYSKRQTLFCLAYLFCKYMARLTNNFSSIIYLYKIKSV